MSNQEKKRTVLDIARKSLHEIVRNNKEWNPDLGEMGDQSLTQKQGCFTTLWEMRDGEKKLRGCIGLPYPTKPLAHAISTSARNSATKDHRFENIRSEELDDLKVSVEVLSPVEEIIASSATEFLESFDIGTHGLIVKKETKTGVKSGLLLSKVAVDWNWDKIEFLDHLLQKAWLPFESIDFIVRDDTIKIYKFTSDIYSELE